MGSVGSKVTGGLADAEDTYQNDPSKFWTQAALIGAAAATGGIGLGLVPGVALGGSLASAGTVAALGATAGSVALARRAKDDMRDQAEGRADKQIQQAQIAEARAKDVAVKNLDPLALARRARGSTVGGRQSTILTSANQLGLGETYQKQLLGL